MTQALTTSEVIDIASQCASALLHVSERGFAHTDIKTDKVYLHKNAHGGWHAKIGGTGYAFPREVIIVPGIASMSGCAPL